MRTSSIITNEVSNSKRSNACSLATNGLKAEGKQFIDNPSGEQRLEMFSIRAYHRISMTGQALPEVTPICFRNNNWSWDNSQSSRLNDSSKLAKWTIKPIALEILTLNHSRVHALLQILVQNRPFFTLKYLWGNCSMLLETNKGKSTCWYVELFLSFISSPWTWFPVVRSCIT